MIIMVMSEIDKLKRQAVASLLLKFPFPRYLLTDHPERKKIKKRVGCEPTVMTEPMISRGKNQKDTVGCRKRKKKVKHKRKRKVKIRHRNLLEPWRS